ncbi:MAG TPA: hypothetical protein VH593_04505, partial [Ktedonobacteraceae bacterium]
LIGTALLGNVGHGGGHSIGHAHIGHAHIGHAHIGHAHVGHAGHQHAAPHAAHTGHGGRIGRALFSYISPLSIALFLVGFGFFGYVFHTTTLLASPLIFSFSIIGGLFIAGLLLTAMSRIFKDSEGSTVQDVSDRTGLLGKVSLTIPEKGLGEILYVSPGGLRKSIPARSIDGGKVERDQEVIVVNYQNGIADVDTWEHFASQTDDAFAESTSADSITSLRDLFKDKDTSNQNYQDYKVRDEAQKE